MKRTGIVVSAFIALAIPSCSAFKIDVGTEEAIKLDPIKFEPIDVKMRVDVYQHAEKSKEEVQAVKNVKDAVERQRNRMEQVQILKNSRWVGENHLGLLSIINEPAGKDGEWVRMVVTEENADRAFLMTDRSNSSGESLAAIRRQQWQTRVQNSHNGEWVEEPGDTELTYRWVPKQREKKQQP